MGPSLYDVYLVEAQWGLSRDRRPAVVTRLLLQKRYLRALISSALDLYDPTVHFLVPHTYPDQPATGLLRASFISSREVIVLGDQDLKRRLGSLEGMLRQEFIAWWSLRAY